MADVESEVSKSAESVNRVLHGVHGQVLRDTSQMETDFRSTVILKEVLQEVAQSACQMIGADIVVIHLYDSDRREFYDLEYSVVFPPKAQLGMEKPRSKGGLTAWIIEEGPFRCEDVSLLSGESKLSAFVEARGIKAYWGIPLIGNGEPLGVMHMSFMEEHSFSSQEIALSEILVNYACVAIYNDSVLATSGRKIHELRALQRMARVISSILDIKEVMRVALRLIHSVLGFEYATISLVDEDKQEIATKSMNWKGQDDFYPEWLKLSRYPLDHEDIQADIVRTGKTETIDKWDDRFNKAIWDEFGHEQLLRIFMPIMIQEKVIGTLEAGYDKESKDSIEQDEKDTLRAFVDQVAVAIRNAQLYEEAQRTLKSLREEQSKKIAVERLTVVDTVGMEFAHKMNNVAGTIPVHVKQIKELLDLTVDPTHLNYATISHYLDSISQDAGSLLDAAESIRSPASNIELELVDIGILVSDVIQRMKPPSGIIVSGDCGDSIPLVPAFREKLRNMLENLIRNSLEAVEHSGKDSGMVTVSCNVILEGNREWVVVEIQDTGCGIQRTDLDRVFELSYSTKPGGMGIALWRAKTLVEILGGRIEVSSKLDEGTTFTILLPVEGEAQG